MSHEFDKDYWEQHWRDRPGADPDSMSANPPNPYLATEVANLRPGTALDAGCGAGVEAIWLASAGWQVTAADISTVALSSAAERAAATDAGERIEWVQADLSTWRPDHQFDLVMTHYAHPAMPQLDFYVRISEWVSPGGALLIVGHLQTHDHEGSEPPVEATATAAAITGLFSTTRWEILTADERHRTVPGRALPLHDVVVRATRRRHP